MNERHVRASFLCSSLMLRRRNIVIGPSTKTIDLAAVKIHRFSEDRAIEFRIETFNLFNFTNFDLPNRFAFTPNFGKIFSAGSSRQIQFGIKLSF